MLAWRSWNILAPSTPEESSLVPVHKGWTQGRQQDVNVNGPGSLQAATLREGEANLLLELAPSCTPCAGSGLHLFLGTRSHRGDCLLREAVLTHQRAKPGRGGHVGGGGSICHRQHKPLNIRANLDQQILLECTNHLLFLSFFFLSKLCLLC